MSSSKLVLSGAAGALGGGAGLDVNEVFSTFLHTGTGATKSIVNGIDLSGEGGLVWSKARSSAYNHGLIDTERGVNKDLRSNSTNGEATRTGTSVTLTAFNSDGFSLGQDASSDAFNRSGVEYATWTFRKAPKFFDVVTYTGNSTAGRSIAHNLGCEVGAIFVKRTDQSNDWIVYHRANTSQPETDYLSLNLTNATTDNSSRWNDTAPTTTEFTVGDNVGVNETAGTYVAYLFAHNDGDGEFGPTGDQDIIKCGSFTTDGSGGVSVDLGFEPQWIMYKPTSTTGPWVIVDSMRGWTANSESRTLTAESSGAEQSVVNLSSSYPLNRRSDGFDTSNALYASQTYIYIAIRRGPMAVPTDADDVFGIDTRAAASGGTPAFTSGFPVDFSFTRRKSGTASWELSSRLIQGKRLYTNLTNAETSDAETQFDYMDGWNAATGANSDILAWMWKRAPNYFDVVAYTGNGVAGRTVSHNLGVAPEMMWVKSRGDTESWCVYHSGITNPEQNYLYLNESSALNPNSNTIKYWNHTAPTDSVFTLGIEDRVNQSGDIYIAYLFASVDGVSKVGSFTYAGTTLNVDCGFSAGARFVLYKRYNTTGSWLVLDTERGINASANDPVLYLNATDAEDSGYNLIEPYSAGFTITGNDVGNGDYIFYAIA